MAESSGKLHPSFREQDQHLAEGHAPVIVGPPAYSSPDPDTNNYSLNPVEEHHADLPDDYGAGAPKTVSHSLGGVVDDSDAPPADREEWTKAHWSDRAKELGVSVKGKKDEVRKHVEKAEAANAKADDDES